MQVLDRQTGQLVDIPDSQVAAAYASGRYGVPKGARVPVRLPGSTEVGTVAGEELGTALGAGYEPITPTELKRERLQFEEGDLAGSFQAAGEGAARGLTLGLSDAALVGLGADPDRIEARQEANPFAAIGSEAVGAIAPILATGGAGAAGSGAKAGGSLLGTALRTAGAAPRLAAGAGQLAERGAARLLGEGLGARAVGYAAGGAVEGGIAGVGSAVGHAAIKNERLTAEQLYAAVTRDALIGGVAGGILGGGAAAAGDAVTAGARSVGNLASDAYAGITGSQAYQQLAPRLRQAVDSLDTKSIEQIAQNVYGYVPAGLGDRVVKLAASLSGDDPDAIRRLAQGGIEGGSLFSPEAKRARQIAFYESEEIRDKAVRDLTERLDNVRKAYDEAGEKFRGLEKLDAINKLIRRDNPVEQVGETYRVLDEVEAELADMRKSGAYAFDKQLDELVKVVQQQRGRFEASLDKPRARKSRKGKGQPAARPTGYQSPELQVGDDPWGLADPAARSVQMGSGTTAYGPFETGYAAIDQVKRSMQHLEESIARTIPRSGDVAIHAKGRPTLERLESIQERLRQHLMNEKLYGEAATAQRSINDPWMRLIAAQKNLDVRAKLFQAYKEGEIGAYGTSKRADPEMIARFVDRLTDPRKDLVHQDLRQWLEQGEAFIANVKKYGAAPADGEMQKYIANFEGELAGLRKTLDDASEALALRNISRELTTGEGLLGGAGAIGAGLSLAMGSVAPLAVGVAASGVGALSAPGRTIRQLAAIEKLAGNVGGYLEKGIGAYFDRIRKSTVAGKAKQLASQAYDTGKQFAKESVDAAKRVAREGAKRTRQAGALGATIVARSESPEATYRREKERLELIARYPDAARERLARSTRHVAGTAPGVVAALHEHAMRVESYLATKLPPARPAGPLGGKEALPSPSELARFQRIVAAAEDPGRIVDELEAGVLTRDTVETVRAVSPALFAEVQRCVMAQIEEMRADGEEIPYRERLKLGTLLDIPADPMLEPERMGMLQAANYGQAPEGSAAAMGRDGAPAPRTRRPSETGKRRLTNQLLGMGDKLESEEV